MRLETSTKIVLMFAAVALALTVMDLATTYVGVSNGAQELNPVVASDINSMGLVNALLLAAAVPFFAFGFSISGTVVCNRMINGDGLSGFSLKERWNIKIFIALGLAALLTGVIISRGLAVCNNITGLLEVGII